MESWVQSWRPRTNASCDFPLHLSKVLRLPRKIDARSYEVLHLSRNIIWTNLKIWCSKMQPLSGNQRPDLLTSLMNMSLVLRLPRKMQFCRSSSNVPRLPSFWKCCKTLTFFSLLTRCAIPCACHAKRDLSAQKWSVHGVFCAFWLRNVLRTTTACTFRHLNEHEVFCTCWLRNVLRATMVCTFLTSQLPKVVRTWGVFSFLTCKCASCHSGVQFFISHLPRCLRTRGFSEPTFRPSGASGATNHWEKTLDDGWPESVEEQGLLLLVWRHQIKNKI